MLNEIYYVNKAALNYFPIEQLLYYCSWFLIRKAIWYVSNCWTFEYYVVFIYFQAADSALLAVSVLYVEKKSK